MASKLSFFYNFLFNNFEDNLLLLVAELFERFRELLNFLLKALLEFCDIELLLLVKFSQDYSPTFSIYY